MCRARRMPMPTSSPIKGWMPRSSMSSSMRRAARATCSNDPLVLAGPGREMIFWHMGVAAAIVYSTLGRRRIDYRFVLLGAVLPDIVDGLLGLFLFNGPA